MNDTRWVLIKFWSISVQMIVCFRGGAIFDPTPIYSRCSAMFWKGHKKAIRRSKPWPIFKLLKHSKNTETQLSISQPMSIEQGDPLLDMEMEKSQCPKVYGFDCCCCLLVGVFEDFAKNKIIHCQSSFSDISPFFCMAIHWAVNPPFSDTSKYQVGWFYPNSQFKVYISSNLYIVPILYTHSIPTWYIHLYIYIYIYIHKVYICIYMYIYRDIYTYIHMHMII